MTLRPLTSHQSNEGILKRIFVSVGLCFEQIVWVAKQVIQRRDLRIKLLAIVLVALGWALRPAFATLFLNSKLCILRSGYEPNKDQGPKGSLISQPSLYNTLMVHWEVERSRSLCHELLLIVFPTHVDDHVCFCALLPGRVHSRRDLLQAVSRGAGSRRDGRPHDALVEPAAVVKAGHRGDAVTRQAELTHSGDLRKETHFQRAFC